MSATKWRLFKAAVDLFASKGFSNVSVRDIAAATKLNPASLYNHFSCKEAFLTEACKFCKEHCHADLLPIESVLDEVGKMSPSELRKKIHPGYEPETFDLITKIILIAICERRSNDKAHDLVCCLFIDMPKEYVGALLKEMVAKEIIEPLDIDSFINVFSAFDFYCSARLGGKHELSFDEWSDGHELIFSLLKFRDKGVDAQQIDAKKPDAKKATKEIEDKK